MLTHVRITVGQVEQQLPIVAPNFHEKDEHPTEEEKQFINLGKIVTYVTQQAKNVLPLIIFPPPY